MANNLKYSAALKTARLGQVATSVAGSCKIDLYDGVQPASPDTAITTQNLLVECIGNATFTATNTGGVLTAAAIATGTGTAVATSGGKTATWGRISTSGGTAVVDFTVGATSGFDMNCTPDSVIKTGTPFDIPTFTVTAGN